MAADADPGQRVKGASPARDRLATAALQTFAYQGYQGASTRDICAAAGMNNASIHYHFGDKAGLYRELYRRALETYRATMRAADIGTHQGRAALLAYHGAVLRMHSDESFAPLAQLHLREESHPSGIVDDLRPRSMELLFEFIGGLVLRELGLEVMDRELRRLVLTLHGTGLVYVVKRQGIAEAVDGLLDGPGQLDELVEHLADMGMAMIEAERRRRATPPAGWQPVVPLVSPEVVPAVAKSLSSENSPGRRTP